MPPRTRVPCTWTTSWPGVPGSPSKPGTVALQRRPRSPPSSLPSSAGDRQMLIVRWSTITSGLHAERESQHQPDDLSADAARLGAPDVRMGRVH